MRGLVLFLFFLSGALGLVYEVVWSRTLTHVFGTTALAVGTVLAAFMSGLALGSWLLGKLADRSGDPLRLYAMLELGVGLTALGAHLLLVRITPIYLTLHEALGGSETLWAVMRFALAFVLVLVPTSLMGATLPVLARFVVRGLADLGARLSTLYAPQHPRRRLRDARHGLSPDRHPGAEPDRPARGGRKPPDRGGRLEPRRSPRSERRARARRA